MGARLASRRSLAGLTLLLAVGAGVLGACQTRSPAPTRTTPELPSTHPRARTRGTAFEAVRAQVLEGTAAAAETYYRQTVSPQIQFLTEQTILGSTIRDLLNYVGYPDLTATDLHRFGSDDLMSAPGDILATRFFAPKITDVADRPAVVPRGGFGWRKLVRLRAKPGSAAAANGIEALWFLQNVIEATAEGDPFDAERNVSRFNQAILVRREAPLTPVRQPLYFLTYGELVKLDAERRIVKDASGNLQDDGRLTLNLEATFNEDDRIPETNSDPKKYFVPDSCVACHGRSRGRAKLNYLDSDHWFDRVTPLGWRSRGSSRKTSPRWRGRPTGCSTTAGRTGRRSDSRGHLP